MVHELYRRGFSKYGESPKALHWVNYTSQAIRFKHLVAQVELEGKTILDAGCGMGDILPFLYAKADRFDYLGVDKNEDFIAIAKKRYNGHKFRVGDPFFDRIRTKYDVVLSSGVLNHNVKDWLNLRQQMIAALFEQTRETLAFNMAGAFHYIPPDRKIAYANAQEIYDYCLGLCPNSTLITGYSNYDFTVVMNR